MNKINIFGINIDLIDSDKINNTILEICTDRKKEVISNVNIHALNIAFHNKKMREFLNAAYINFIDGDGVNLGAKLLNLPTGPKVTYDWWIWEFARFSMDHNISWYILGAKQESLSNAVIKLRSRFNKLEIKGYHNGYFDENGDENKEIIDEINNLKPNILIMAMGMPKQEEWLYENWSKLKVNVALTGGAVIDYVSGNFRSTPKFYRKHKIEWFYRLVNDPRRLFKRYVCGNPMFIWRILCQKFS